MSDKNDEAGKSSETAIQPHDAPPNVRSHVKNNVELLLKQKSFEPYKEKAKVYLKGARGVDPKPYKIYKVLEDGQYKLSRDGKSDGKVYLQENLQTEP